MTTYSGPVFYDGGGSGIQRQRFEIDFTDFTAAATSQSVDQATDLSAGMPVMFCFGVTEAFAGPSITAVVLDFGVSGGNTDLGVDASSVFAITAYAYTPGDGTAPVPSVAQTMAALITATGGNVADFTAGHVVVDAYYIGGSASPDDE